MPRGEYDRKESKIHRLEADIKVKNDELRKLREEADKMNIEVRGLKKVVELAEKVKATPAAPPVPVEKFELLRETLTNLANTRKTLVDSDQMNEPLLSQLDSEIRANLNLLAALRLNTFGEPPRSSELPSVPMPAHPIFPSVPPVSPPNHR